MFNRIACSILTANFIGIEKDDKYFEIAKKRIERHGGKQMRRAGLVSYFDCIYNDSCTYLQVLSSFSWIAHYGVQVFLCSDGGGYLIWMHGNLNR